MTHVIIRADGYESAQSGLGFTVSGGADEQTVVSYSRHGYRWNLAGGTGGWLYTPGTAEVWASYHLYFDALPAAGQFFYLFRNYYSAVTRTAVRLNGTTGLVEIYSSSSGTWEAGDSSYVVLTGVWYILSCYAFQNNSGPKGKFVLRLRDTGATVDSRTHSVVPNGAGLGDVTLGPYAASNGNMVIDNAVSEEAAQGGSDDPVSALSTRYAVGYLPPVGTGFYDAATGTWADVDEVPHDSDTTYRSLAGTSAVFTQKMAALTTLVAPVASIRGTIHHGVARQTAGTGTSTHRLRSGSTDVDGANFSDAGYTIHWAYRETDPGTGLAWTVAGVEAAEVGWKMTSSATHRCTEVGLGVLYTVGSIVRKKRVVYGIFEFDPEQKVYDLERNEPIPLEEVQPNVGWLRLVSDDLAPLPSSDSAWDDETLVPIESVRYDQGAGGTKLSIEASGDRFVERLAARVSDSAGSI